MSNTGYLNSFGTYNNGQYGSLGYNTHYSNNDVAYVGQSYVPPQNQWLPLPGVNRRQQ